MSYLTRILHVGVDTLAAVVLAGSLPGASEAVAAPVIFARPATIAGDTDATTAGSAVYAFDLSNIPVTLNSVSFGAGNSASSLGGGQITMSGFPSVNNSAFSGGTSNPWNGLSAGYKNLLRGAVHTVISAAPATVTLNALTMGHQYAVQLWVNDSRATSPPADRQEIIASQDGNTWTLDYNNLDGLGGVGEHTVGLFTADATAQSFTLSGLTASPSGQMNAIQLRDVSNLGYWVGTSGAAWDAATTTNFADNLHDAPLNLVSFDVAKAPLDAVTFADAYWDGGTTVPVTQTNVAIAAGGVSAGQVLFQNDSLDYTVTSSDAVGIGGATAVGIVGGGTVEFAGTHTYSGATTIGAGELRITDKSQVSATSGIHIGDQGTLTVTAVGGNWDADWNRITSGGGTWVLQGSGNTSWTQITGDLSGFTGTLHIGPDMGVFGSSVNNYPGAGATIHVAAGAEFNVLQTISPPPGTVHLYGGTGPTAWDTTDVALRTTGAGTVSYDVHVHADTTIGCWPNQSGATYMGNFELGTNALTVKVGGAADTLTIHGAVSGAGGSLVKTGPGTLVLSADNRYSGATVINVGTLRLAVNPAGMLPDGLRVMPMGDSITYGGSGSNAGYRGPLYNLLHPAASNVVYVGASTANPGSLPVSPVNQTHHNGYGSYATLDLSNNLDGYDPTRYNQFGGVSRDPHGGYWLDGGHGTGRDPVYPDVVLIMVGANDIYQHNQGNPQINLPNFQTNLTTLVSKLVTARPNARVIVARMTPYLSHPDKVPTIHAGVEAVVAAFQAQGERVSMVDLHTEFPAGGLTGDGVHPNDTGFNWMAARWTESILASYAGATDAIPADSPVTVAAGATLDVNGAHATIGGLNGDGNVVLGSGSLTVGSTNSSIFGGVISGAGGLTSSGSGTVTLDGPNTYAGATAVSNGTLLVNGSIGTGAAVVDVAGRLGGTGTLNGPTTIGGTLAPGTSVGTLTVSNDLVLSASAVLDFELGTNSDQVAVSGDLTVGGTLDIVDAGGFTTNTYTLFTHGGALTNSGMAVGSMPDPAFAGVLDTNTAGEVNLRVELTPFAEWQIEHYGSYTNADAAADVDSDDDGLSNGEEFLCGTAPTNRASVLQCGGVEGNGGEFYTVTWDSVGGRIYRVQFDDGHLENFADILTDIPDTNASGLPGSLRFTDEFTLTAPPSGGVRYYRVRLLQE